MKKYWKHIVVAVIAILFAVFASIDFVAMHQREEVKPSKYLTEEKMLSDYCDGLKGTPMDTPVYVFDSGVKGGAFLILGGTHPNESAGLLTALAYVENLHVTKGRVFVIPWTNAAGFTHTSPIDGMQDFFTLTVEGGAQRTFRVGNRLSNPIYQWPDRNFYLGSSGRKLVGTETPEIRNVNRMYFGDEDGVLTEKVCWGIFQLIKQEDVNICMDMHEGSPEFMYLDCTMVNEHKDNATAMSVASAMCLDMQFDNLDMRAEYSGVTSYGLSHRSLGDNTDCMMTLMETYNPSMGPLHGKMTDQLMIDGKEDNYYKAHVDGFVYYNARPEGIPLIERVARHATCIRYLAEEYSFAHPGKEIEFTGIGTFDEILAGGFEKLLRAI